jgi:hypothetical protein
MTWRPNSTGARPNHCQRAISVQLARDHRGHARLPAAKPRHRSHSTTALIGVIPKLIVRVRFPSPALTVMSQDIRNDSEPTLIGLPPCAGSVVTNPGSLPGQDEAGGGNETDEDEAGGASE